MKSTGIVRRVDELGRVVIPIELRKQLSISEKDPIEISTSGNSIILRKYEDACIFCGKNKNLSTYRDKLVCSKCLNGLTTLAEEDAE